MFDSIGFVHSLGCCGESVSLEKLTSLLFGTVFFLACYETHQTVVRPGDMSVPARNVEATVFRGFWSKTMPFESINVVIPELVTASSGRVTVHAARRQPIASGAKP